MMLAAISRPRLSLENSALSAAPVDGRVGDFAVAVLQRDAVAAGASDLAFGDAHGFHVIEMHQRAALRQRPAAAVEREAAERNGVGVLGRQQRRPLRQDQPRGAADAGKIARRPAA